MPSYSSKQKSSFVIKTCEKEGNTKKIASLEHLGTLLAENRKATHKHRAFFLTTASVLAGKQTLSHFWRERKRCFSFDGNANAASVWRERKLCTSFGANYLFGAMLVRLLFHAQ